MWDDPGIFAWLMLAIFMAVILAAFLLLGVLVYDCATNYC